jgi:hypothetical protein
MEGYEIKYGTPTYIIPLFRVTQNGVTSVITNVTSYRDTIYAIEVAEGMDKYENKRVVVLTNIYGQEIYYESEFDALINIISGKETISMYGKFTGKDVFDAIYEKQFKSLNADVLGESSKNE